MTSGVLKRYLQTKAVFDHFCTQYTLITRDYYYLKNPIYVLL